MIQQGEIWWGDLPDDKPRPFLVLTRQRAIPSLRSVVVAPITSQARGLVSEVPLGAEDGLRIQSVASFDNVDVLPKSLLVRRLGALAPGRWNEVCAAMRAAIDC